MSPDWSTKLMTRRILLIAMAFTVLVGIDMLQESLSIAAAQDENPFFYDHDPHAMHRGAGGYFAWYKLLLITLVFAAWVGIADYANREALRLSEFVQTKAEVWNPIFVVTFLLGFIAVMSIPWFWAGFPVYFLLCFVPLIFFFIGRNQQVDPSMRKAVSASGSVSGPIQILKNEQLDLNPIELVATAQPDKTEAQTLFAARQTQGFVPLKDLVSNALKNRADIVALSCTQEKAVAQMQVDGIWHPMAEFDPATGQMIAATSQYIAGCNPQIMDQPQDGGFRVKRDKSKWAVRFSSQPTRTDFRCVYRFETNDDNVMSLVELGMTEEQANKVREGIAGDGVFVVASMPGQGVTTLWRTCLQATDRWTRDWFSVVPDTDTDTIMENVGRETFPTGDVDAAIAKIHHLALKQAGGYAVPELFDKRLVDTLLEQSKTEGRKTLTRFSAKSASEGLLRAYAAAGDRKSMAKALKGAVFQKLVRKLCTNCRETTKVAPELITKLGGDPREQDFVYTTRTIPAELPKEYQPCPVCHDIGFVGRTGIFEIIEVNDHIRKVLLTDPKVDKIAQMARKTGNPAIMNSGFRLILDGTTTLDELKRAAGS